MRTDLRNTILAAYERHIGCIRQKEQLELAIQEAKGELEAAKMAREVITKVGKSIQTGVEGAFTSIVSLALQSVFGDTYQFQLRFTERRNQLEADLVLIQDGNECSPIDSVGGGVVDICSLALRIAALIIQQSAKVVVLDEPCRCLSTDLQNKASEMIKTLSEKLGIQFIIVTHEEELTACADKIFTIDKGAVVC